MKLQNYACGEWVTAATGFVALRDASTGDVVAECSSAGLDFRAMMDYARTKGGPALRALTFHQRALMLKALAQHLTQHKDEFYSLSYATGATKADTWIDVDGGISTLFVYASKGRRELPNDHVLVDGAWEGLSKSGRFVGQHIFVPLEGVAVHINAFNFPCWGMLEKLSSALLAGVPAIIKPATVTAYLAEAVFRRIVESRILPEGAVQLVCGALGDAFDHVTCQDLVAFTGSAATAHHLSTHPEVVANATRFFAETDSLNASILGSDAAPGTPEFDLFVKEVATEMTVKAGQKCTAIRRALVPAVYVDEVAAALRARLGEVTVGNPRAEGVKMGPLAGLAQREEVRARVADLKREADVVYDGNETLDPAGGDAGQGAFFAPVLLRADEAAVGETVHRVEAFGPVSTLIPYGDVDEAIDLARRGEGSLAGSIFTYDAAAARQLALGLAPYHGRLVLINRDCAKDSTGHGSPLPHMVHGGPGRAGGSEELGGVRSVKHYMQRTAVQGTPSMLTGISHVWIKGADEHTGGVHPFRQYFDDLVIGTTLHTEAREITLADVESFADLTGDHFYAHMDEEAARRNPFFDGRVAHGYLVLSAAAGLFVDPDPGPVLANYGLDALNFLKPVYPGDRIKVRLTVKQKTERLGADYGEVRWDVEVTNQDGDVVAAYDLLTMNAMRGSLPS